MRLNYCRSTNNFFEILKNNLWSNNFCQEIQKNVWNWCCIISCRVYSEWTWVLPCNLNWPSLLFKVFTLIEISWYFTKTQMMVKILFEAMLYSKFLICWSIYLSLVCYYSLFSNSLPHLWQNNKLNIPWPVSNKSYDATPPKFLSENILKCCSNGYFLRGRDLSNSTLVPNTIHVRLS